MSTSSSGHWHAAENGTSTSSYGEKDNVFYERVMSYPVAKVMQVMEPVSPRSPGPASPYQTVVYTTDQSQQQYIQEMAPPYSPTPYQQSGTVRRYIIQNPEQEMQAPFQQGTIRRYYVQNPEQQNSFLNYVPGNNVIYEKTITRIDGPNTEQEKHITRGMSSVSVNDIQEHVHQRKGSTLSSEQEFVFEQQTERKGLGQSVFEQQTERKGSVQSPDQTRSEQVFGTNKMDSRYFGELLAELSRKNNDLYSCLLQHVEKIGGRKQLDSTSEYQTEDIESVIPKGVSELTKQQIRYLLQMRQTSDKSMRLVLSTFNTLREDLGHLQGDLNKLETDKSLLERDLSFKESQVKEYETLLASVRESNRQQQQALKESALKIRRLEEQILLLKNSDADKEYRLKELEYSKQAMEQENDNLRLQISDTCSSPTIVKKTEEISKHYMEMLLRLREEKDKEIHNLRTQISTFQHDVTSKEGSSRDLQMKIIELTSTLQRTELLVKKQQEELFRLRQERESKGGVTKAIITKKYRNQYPILGLLSDYNATSPIKDTQTIVIERTGEMWKQEFFTTS
ncbi:protein POF1B isoform X1 [Ambystoma mexicanum]|uniref:protein POF1B isoform X1 n=3 Tax=Ambystoma mexicanum TaxID=8296 RepID=UPI0037E8D236